MATQDYDFCRECIYLAGGETPDFDEQGHRIFANSCTNGYDLISTSELCRRPEACKRHTDKRAATKEECTC